MEAIILSKEQYTDLVKRLDEINHWLDAKTMQRKTLLLIIRNFYY